MSKAKISELIKKYKKLMKSHQIFMEERDVTKYFLARDILKDLEKLLEDDDT